MIHPKMRSVPDYCFDSHSNDRFDGEYLRNSVPVHSQVRVNNYSAGPRDDDVSCVSIAQRLSRKERKALLPPFIASIDSVSECYCCHQRLLCYRCHLRNKSCAAPQESILAAVLPRPSQYYHFYHSRIQRSIQDAAEKNRYFLGSKQYSSETISDLQ